MAIDLLRAAGTRVVRVPVRGSGPFVVATSPGRAPDAPTVLCYGHYDVVPAGPGWTSPPFAPVVRGGRIVGRGASDDKGPLLACIAALRAWNHVGGPPGRVVVLADGGEESGSPGLVVLARRLARGFRPDVVLCCDTERAPAGEPSLTAAQRGRLLLEVAVDTGRPPRHPGRSAGPDPTLQLADTLLRLRSRAAVSVISSLSGSGSGQVPARAHAVLDVRTPAGTDPQAVVRDLRRHLAHPATTTLRVRSAHPGAAGTPHPHVVAALSSAARQSFGTSLRVVSSGGSLPAAAVLGRAFARTPALLGLAPHGSRAHGPDEFLDLEGFDAGVELLVRFLGAPTHPV